MSSTPGEEEAHLRAHDKDMPLLTAAGGGSVIDLSNQSTPFLDKSDEEKLYSPTLAESSSRIAREVSTSASSSGSSDFLASGSSSAVARQMTQNERYAFVCLCFICCGIYLSFDSLYRNECHLPFHNSHRYVIELTLSTSILHFLGQLEQ